MTPDLVHVEPPQERSGLCFRTRGDPRDRRVRRRTPRAGGADHAAGEHVEQARLADPGPAHQGEDVRRSLEAEPPSRVLEDATRARHVEPQPGGGSDRVVERREARGEGHAVSGAIAARSSSASARSSSGSAVNRS